MFALMAQGLILIYRATGVLNFAHGAIGVAGTYLYYELSVVRSWPTGMAVVCGVLFSAAIGLIVHLVIMRRLRAASPLVRVVATLAVMAVLTATFQLRYGASVVGVPSILPNGVWQLSGGNPPFLLAQDRVILAAIAIAVTGVLMTIQHRTLHGLATSAVADNEQAAAALGWSPRFIGAVNWAVGSALAAVAGIFIVPIAGLRVLTLTTLLLSGIAAALVARFASFSVALVAGLGIGVAQSLLARYASDVTGLSTSLPFLVVIAVMVIRGRALPLRSYATDKLPSIGSGKLRLGPIIAVSAVAIFWILSSDDRATSRAIATTAIVVILLLSFTVITGYAGQLSLAQFAFAGIGAFIAGRLQAAAGVPLTLAFVIGVLGAAVIGALIAVPAVRTRGVNLAIITLGLGEAVVAIVFNDASMSGGGGGTAVGVPTLFGWPIGGREHLDRYAIVAVFWVVVVALVVAWLRQSALGRNLIAIRTNERAAAAMGIDVVQGKVVAFAIASGIAGLAGILLGYQNANIVYANQFGSDVSIEMLTLAVIGGIGYIGGALIGSLLAPAGIIDKVVSGFFDDIGSYLPIIAGFVVLLNLMEMPNGIFPTMCQMSVRIASRLRRIGRGDEADSCMHPRPVGEEGHRASGRGAREAERVPQMEVRLHDVVVRFGGLTAVDEVSFEVRTGRVLGLIGSNGAGKSTVIDAVTGFTKTDRGRVFLGNEDATGHKPHWWARAGVSRSFQSLELFEDLTVAENLRAAADERSPAAFMPWFGRRRTRESDDLIAEAVRGLELEEELHHPVSDLSHGTRRLVAIARAMATGPSLLLLDEPAAGLSDAESGELARMVRQLVDERGVGVLLVEHDMHFIGSLCDEIVVLEHGAVIARGTPTEVMSDPAVIASYLGRHDDG